jgi:hypothetical protein
MDHRTLRMDAIARVGPRTANGAHPHGEPVCNKLRLLLAHGNAPSMGKWSSARSISGMARRTRPPPIRSAAMTRQLRRSRPVFPWDCAACTLPMQRAAPKPTQTREPQKRANRSRQWINDESRPIGRKNRRAELPEELSGPSTRRRGDFVLRPTSHLATAFAFLCIYYSGAKERELTIPA